MRKGDPQNRRQLSLGSEGILGRILDRELRGQALHAPVVECDDALLYVAACRQFGSWRRALECAGFDPDTVRRNCTWDRHRIITHLQRRAMKGASLRRKDILRQDRGLVAAISKLFGSWQKALEAVGVNAEEFCVQQRWNRQQIVEAILLRAVKRQPLGSKTVKPSSLKTAAVAEFGTWSAALQAAGLDPKEHMGFVARKANLESKAYRNRDDIKRAILQRQALGYDCDFGTVCKQDRRLYYAIRRFFGSFEKALQFASASPVENS